jgi:rhodanese-related sulfurtransferase
MKNYENINYLKVLTLCLLAVLILGSLFIYSCKQEQLKSEPVKISPQKVYEILKAKDPKYIILDVRTKEEFDSGHLDSALLIPVDELEIRFGELLKNKPVIVYCKSGSRSAKSAGILIANNFSPVYDMTGGIDAWTGLGYPVVVENASTAGQDTGQQSGNTSASSGDTSRDSSGSTLVNYLTADELYSRIKQGEDIAILDVRSNDSFLLKHIKGAINIPYTELVQRTIELDKSKVIIVYCSDTNCGLSKNAFDTLTAAGFTKVFTLEGGIESWRAKGYPVE